MVDYLIIGAIVLFLITVAGINFKLGRIARSMERIADIELPTLTAAVSEVSMSIDDGERLPDLMVIDKVNGRDQ